MTDVLVIRFRLLGDKAQALRRLAATQMRRPNEQARYIVCQCLETQDSFIAQADLIERVGIAEIESHDDVEHFRDSDLMESVFRVRGRAHHVRHYQPAHDPTRRGGGPR